MAVPVKVARRYMKKPHFPNRIARAKKVFLCGSYRKKTREELLALIRVDTCEEKTSEKHDKKGEAQ